MKKILVLVVLLAVALTATFASGVIEGIKYPINLVSVAAPAAEQKAEIAAAVEASKAEPAVVVETPASAPVVEVPVAVAPVAVAKAIALADSAVAKLPMEQFVPDSSWKQIACAPAMAETAAALVGAKNIVVLADDATVVANVQNGLFAIGILPADAATPEGCVGLQVANK